MTETFLSFAAILLLFIVVVIVAMGQYKTYRKAGEPGWAIVIPIYSTYVLARMGDKPVWWGIIAALVAVQPDKIDVNNSSFPILAAIAITGLIFYLLITIGVAKNFGKSTAYGIVLLGLLPIIGYPILGFGNAKFKALREQ